jgi:hypothetical protein
MTSECNDGRFPDDSAVLVRYPVDGHRPASDRQTWPWLAGTIKQQCGPMNGWPRWRTGAWPNWKTAARPPAGTPDGDLLFPQCYRDSSELRPVPQPGLEVGQ